MKQRRACPRVRPSLLPPLWALLLLAACGRQTGAILDPRPGSDVNWWSAGSQGQQQQQQQQRTGHGKSDAPNVGFGGGSGLNNNRVVWCRDPGLPGCQSCPNSASQGCLACWYQFPNATGSSFVLNPATRQCDCAPGYGLLPQAGPPVWLRRHLLHQPSDTTAAATGSSSGVSLMHWGSKHQQPLPPLQLLPALEQQQHSPAPWYAGTDESREELPPWAAKCLPCPVNYYSPGGQQGFAQCLPCPGTFTTAGAVAAANCLFPYCGPGQEPTRASGRCRPCPFGTYSGATANNQPCYTCPANFTTPSTGSTSYTDCRVPVCRPGQYLDIDLFVCYNCTGNAVSAGGKLSQGPYQPGCKECPAGSVANQTRTTCYKGVCPYPTNFGVTCRTTSLLNTTDYFLCGPNAKPVAVTQYCTATPPGAQLAVMVRVPTYNADNTVQTGYRLVLRDDISCPAAANASNEVLPVIVSFNNRTDCLCACPIPGATANCAFANSPTSGAFVDGVPFTRQCLASAAIKIPDPQLTSLQALVTSLAGSNDTWSMSALGGSYCQPQLSLVTTLQPSLGAPGTAAFLTNWTDSLEVNCSAAPQQFITRVSLSLQDNPWPWAGDGTLPPARRLVGLPQLTTLVCDGCGLDGTLPRDWGTSRSLAELRYLNLGGNTFTGTLPETWGYMSNLVNLTLSSGSQSLGVIPSAWGFMRSLAFVNLTGTVLDASACAPLEWDLRNGLVLGDTLLPPSNVGDFTFCSAAAAAAAAAGWEWAQLQ